MQASPARVPVIPGIAVPDLDLGEGYVISGDDLRPVLNDVTAYRAANAEDPALEAIVAMTEGRADEALDRCDQLLTQHPGSLRYRALRADALGDLGELTQAEAEFSVLVHDTAGDAGLQAMMRQHRAEVWTHQGRLAEAETEFAEVLATRQAVGADAAMLASTRQSLARVRSAREAPQESG